jgi:hypothetical protein
MLRRSLPADAEDGVCRKVEGSDAGGSDVFTKSPGFITSKHSGNLYEA